MLPLVAAATESKSLEYIALVTFRCAVCREVARMEIEFATRRSPVRSRSRPPTPRDERYRRVMG